MMKKILLVCSAVFALTFALRAQNSNPSLRTASTPTLVMDTLHYYLNKHYFTYSTTNYSAYPRFRADASLLKTYTNVAMCGSRFNVPAGKTITVTGLEAFVAKENNVISLTIPIRIYMYTISPTSGLPSGPPIDSVTTAIGGSGSPPPAMLIGKHFTYKVPVTGLVRDTFHTMTSDFAVMVRNVSSGAGDVAHFLRTAAATPTGPAQQSKDRLADGGYGFVKYNGQFYKTTDFTLIPKDFGIGTDYEFMVAPRVEYELQAGHQVPAGVVPAGDPAVPDTNCARSTVYTFTNTSDEYYVHRQYNLNEMLRKFKIYQHQTDSAIAWDFEFYFNVRPDSREFLPINVNTINAQSALSTYPYCFTANEFRARMWPMSALGRVPQVLYTENFKICTRWCDGDTVGIGSHAGPGKLKASPNPAVNGKTTISGLEGKNSVIVYGLLGQIISKEVVEAERVEIDLAKHPKGTYLVRIVGEDNKMRVMKIINIE